MAKRHIALRIDTDDLNAIDQQAHAHKLSRTAFLVGAALQRLGTVGLDGRVDDHEQRLARLEEIAYH